MWWLFNKTLKSWIVIEEERVGAKKKKISAYRPTDYHHLTSLSVNNNTLCIGHFHRISHCTAPLPAESFIVAMILTLLKTHCLTLRFVQLYYCCRYYTTNIDTSFDIDTYIVPFVMIDWRKKNQQHVGNVLMPHLTFLGVFFKPNFVHFGGDGILLQADFKEKRKK